MAWKKGRSGNPAGRKPDAAFAEIRDAAQGYGQEAIDRLVHWMRDDDNPRASITACSVLLDRGYGKATQKIDVEKKIGIVEIVMELTKQRKEQVLLANGSPIIENNS